MSCTTESCRSLLNLAQACAQQLSYAQTSLQATEKAEQATRERQQELEAHQQQLSDQKFHKRLIEQKLAAALADVDHLRGRLRSQAGMEHSAGDLPAKCIILQTREGC